VGTVVFNPVVKGKNLQSVQFTRVLHVPQLRNNLLSILYLTRAKGFNIFVDQNALWFRLRKDNITLFCASINSNNSARLDGTVEPISEYAHLTSTLPLDLSLWHRRLAHHNYADVRKMIREKLVTGMEINSSDKPDPICEPCLAGKMKSNPFPSTGNRAKEPLELVHSDLHGPLPVQSHTGARYWMTFIDDYSDFKGAVPLKKKSDAFNAFKIFKAHAETHFGTKLKALQDC
jgi:hypothetical protein